MVPISTYVFFDIETTGLPHLERNKTKITELSFVAALREDIERAGVGTRPYTSKLTIFFNPQKKIQADCTILTGLCNETLKNAAIFKDKIKTIVSFLEELPKPVCLVAHNGNRFDYKILLAEFIDANASLPNDLLCVDSLAGFWQIFKNKTLPQQIKTNDDSLISDDEDCLERDWPKLNISTEEWSEIDSLCSSFSNMPLDLSDGSLNVSEKSNKKEKLSFSLSSLYKRLVKKEAVNAHQAEGDCLMLLECVVATKEFLPWADASFRSISSIEPLDRNRYMKKPILTSSPKNKSFS